MSLIVYDVEGNKSSEVKVQDYFNYPVSMRLINKAFWLVWSHSLQRKGRDPYAGERTSAQSWNTGRGVSRVARVKGERSPRAGQAAGVAGVVKGRLAKQPSSEKVVYLHINKKERHAAFLSALSAAFSKNYVVARGHKIADETQVPLVVEDSLQELNKAAKLRQFFEKIGVLDDIRRAARRKKRSGKAEWRGRARKEGRGPLLVISEDKGISRAAAAFPGVEVVRAKDLSILHLAPGAVPGRLCIFTLSALEDLKRRVSQDES
ncbi:MAG: 50S ribosomal protein L4 [Conexivisphaerales archaeon]